MSLLVVSRPVPEPRRPYKNTFWHSKLPDDAALHPNTNAIAAEVFRQSQLQQPLINGGQTQPVWSSRVTTVPLDQPTLPGVCTHDSIQQAIAATGIPVPPDVYIPPNPPDTDRAILIYQPDAPNGGVLWELQGFHWLIPGVQWAANSLNRKTGVNSTITGHFVSWVGGPGGNTPGALYSTYESSAWGLQGSGLPYPPGLLTRYDIERGYVDHAVMLEVVNAAAGAHVWPALFRSDGTAVASDPASTLIQGMWIRFPVTQFIDPAWPLMDRLYTQATRDFGAIISDKTLACLAFRMATDANDLCDDFHLTHYPWQNAQALAIGADPPNNAPHTPDYYWHPRLGALLHDH